MADEVSYISGVTSNGLVAATSFQTWNGDGGNSDATSPDSVTTYNSTTSNASKWALGGPSAGPPAIGSAGGTQYYYFDPTSNFTAAQKTALASGLKLWSAVANIQFAEITAAAANPSLASLDFKSTSGGGTYESSGSGTPVPIGSSLLNNQGVGTFLTVNIDRNNGGFDLGNFNSGGSGVGVILHGEGHFLGLGHSGPYNGNANPATQQFSAYDSHEYSLMSYISANDPADKYASSNPNPGATNYGDSTTWMPLDILAVQSLYGAATSGPLSGGQVFGYHDNVSGLVAGVGIHDFFNFSAIITPVVTLYDSGTGNTLDLSGDHSLETIDLRADHYSSFAGDADNLAIAYATAIDTFVGGTAGTNVIVNADADTIKDSGTGNTVTFTGAFASYKFDVINAGKLTVTNIATGIKDTLEGVQTLVFSDATVQTATIGQENHWLVATDGNWTDGARWFNGNPPTAKEAVTLSGLSGTYRVAVDTAGNAAGSLAVSAPGGSAVTLAIAAAGVLDVRDTAKTLPDAATLALGANGTVRVNGGQLNVAGALTNGNGTLDIVTGAAKSASYAQSAGALTIGDGGADASLVLAGAFSETGGTAETRDQGGLRPAACRCRAPASRSSPLAASPTRAGPASRAMRSWTTAAPSRWTGRWRSKMPRSRMPARSRRRRQPSPNPRSPRPVRVRSPPPACWALTTPAPPWPRARRSPPTSSTSAPRWSASQTR